MPKALKEKVLNWIPEELGDKIATEEEATSIEELREFLAKVEHPVMSRDVKMQVLKFIEESEEITAEELMKRFGLSAEELENTLKSLEEEGYLEKELVEALLEDVKPKVKVKEAKEVVQPEEEAKAVELPMGSVTLRIIFKNAKIHIDKIVIKK